MKENQDPKENEKIPAAAVNEGAEDSESPTELDDFNADDLSNFDDMDDSTDAEEGSAELGETPAADDPFGDTLHDTPESLDDNTPTPMGKKTSIIELAKENWLYILIGFVVICVAGYMIVGVISPTGSRPAAPVAQQTGPSFNTPATSTQTGGQAAATTTTPGQPMAVPATPTITMTQPQMDQLMQGFASTVQGSMKDVQTEIQTSGSVATNNNLVQVQDQLGHLDATIAHLNKNLATANDRLNSTQAQLSTVLGQETANQQQLTLRAVVPGRAWLVNGKGQTISVTVGTPLGTIGVVTAIDPDNSTVTTSSGYIFK